MLIKKPEEIKIKTADRKPNLLRKKRKINLKPNRLKNLKKKNLLINNRISLRRLKRISSLVRKNGKRKNPEVMKTNLNLQMS